MTWTDDIAKVLLQVGGALQKSETTIEQPKDDGKGMLFDPFSYWGAESYGGAYRDRPSQMSFESLRSMSYIPLVSAILQVRCTQVASFSRPSEQENYPGFKIKMRDSKRAPSRAAIKRMAELQRFMLSTGTYDDPRVNLLRDDFSTFLKKIVRDSLVYDQMCFQVLRNGKDEPAAFQAMSGYSMRLAHNGDHDGGFFYNPEKPYAVQTFEGQVIAEFYSDELCFGVRNPRSDLEVGGYGFSELEMLIHTLTGYLYAVQYNQKFFSQGMGVKGMLNFKGTIPERQMRAFKREFSQMVTGVTNAWRTPITNADDIQWINLHSSNREMEYSQWLDFLIKVACSIYMIDPAEINFVYGNAGQASAMGTASSLEKVTESKDRGLVPLVLRTFDYLNKYIVQPLDPDFEIVAMGISSKTPEERRKQQETESRFLKTVDELRAEEDLPPLPDRKGEVILNSSWLQWAQVQEANKPDEAEEGDVKVDEQSPREFDFNDFLGSGESEQDQAEMPAAPEQLEQQPELNEEDDEQKVDDNQADLDLNSLFNQEG